MSGLLPIEDLEAAMGVEFGEGAWNTAAGLIVSRGGHVVAVGDYVTVSGCVMRATAIRGHRVLRIEATAPAL